MSIELRPLTLLFGQNSAGKSSLLHSFLLLKHLLTRGYVGSDDERYHVSTADFGNREQYAFLGQVETPTTWILTRDVTRADPETYAWLDPPGLDTFVQCGLTIPGSTGKEQFSRGWRWFDVDCRDRRGEIFRIRSSSEVGPLSLETMQHPCVSELVGQVSGQIESDSDIKPVLSSRDLQRVLDMILSYNLHAKPLSRAFFAKGVFFGGDFERWSGLRMLLQAHRVSETARDALRLVFRFVCEHNLSQSSLEWLCTALYMEELREEDSDWPAFYAYWQANAGNESIANLDDDDLMSEAREAMHIFCDDIWEVVDEYKMFFERLTWEACRDVVHVGYLGPLRSILGREGVRQQLTSETEMSDLEDWRAITRSSELRGFLNQWLGQDRLGSGLEITIKRIYKQEVVRRALEKFVAKGGADVAAALDAMEVEGEAVILRDVQRDREVGLADVGVGIAQVLPVLSRALGWGLGIEMIEQPELHLHPALQADLADAFVSGAFRTGGYVEPKRVVNKRFILETHSEHFILRLLRRVRETAEGRAPEGLELFPEDLGIYYALPSSEGTQFVKVEISPEGDFTTPWPEGFFPERLRELE